MATAAELGAFPIVTNRPDELSMVEAEHRRHAVVELAIRDLKDQALAQSMLLVLKARV